MVFYTAWK